MEIEIVPGLDDDKISEYLKELAPEHEQPGDITISKAKKEWGMSGASAARKLDTLVEKGVLVKIWGMLASHRRGWLYRKPE